ncbi:hypothetical protein B0H12DRAFT_1075734 [Mycena haematopus]|nr:hypothetical protein B0H12DRAFT_1075734 [Mycena haematopus]
MRGNVVRTKWWAQDLQLDRAARERVIVHVPVLSEPTSHIPALSDKTNQLLISVSRKSGHMHTLRSVTPSHDYPRTKYGPIYLRGTCTQTVQTVHRILHLEAGADDGVAEIRNRGCVCGPNHKAHKINQTSFSNIKSVKAGAPMYQLRGWTVRSQMRGNLEAQSPNCQWFPFFGEETRDVEVQLRGP